MINEKEVTSIRPWWSITLVLVLYVIFLLVPSLVLNLLAINNAEVFNWYLNNIVNFWLINFALMTALWLVIVPLLKLPDNKKSFKEYLNSINLNKFKPVIKTIGLGILIGGIILCFVVFTSWLEAKSRGGLQIFYGRLLVEKTIPLNIYYALAPGIWEEVAFRGVIFALLLKKYSQRKTIIINGVMFGLFHLLNLVSLFFMFGYETEIILSLVYSILFQVIYATAIGILLAYLYSKTKSLISVIIIHYLIDAFVTFLTFVIYSPETTMTDTVIRLLMMTTLGIGIVPCAVGCLIIYFVYKKWPNKTEGLKAKLEPSIDMV
ncbi:MAG: CPBP family intramembrane metalloprotease [Candidatus Heimdallarchaeota archaeon]|nr:CPBP family intramembrane metalloprotease [Candidatus Heimdallarchaeota archaeon]